MYTNTFFVLDFDRCLGNTVLFQQILEGVLAETGVSASTFATARNRIEAEGKTFDTIRHTHQLLEQAGSSSSWTEVKKEFLYRAKRQDALLPYARELLQILDERSLAYGIVTYGVEEAWQLIKLEAAKLLYVPHLVTHIEEKGELLTGWKKDDGSFLIPPVLTQNFEALHVQEVFLLDDKAKSFWGTPEGVHGIHVVAPGGNPLPSQQGDVPQNVVDVIGLNGAIDRLFN
ncbi:MAG TPA: hypothetical protein VLG36_03860 [Candidatus Chromulinivoraceae bacterium]|nr:hypothetical protein [Candidatus Chromulinivoraceae bacterium]